MRAEGERTAVVEAARRMVDSGLVINTSGNVSVRVGGTIAITPSRVPYETMTPADVCLVDIASGEQADGALLPSSELPLHLAVYGATDAGAVVHTHSHFATVLSTLVDRLPAIHYQVADLGGEVEVAPYATFGTDELARVTTRALAGRNAALMRNHGVTAIGPDILRALARAFTVEWIASVYWHARVLGTPTLLDGAEIERVAARQADFASRRKGRKP
ncbi:L-fuculose-phosphate aldolase [Burkholderiales bacterium]|nr:L-fuculose-phosphate aldolase [Burkholderiales bacterium]